MKREIKFRAWHPGGVLFKPQYIKIFGLIPTENGMNISFSGEIQPEHNHPNIKKKRQRITRTNVPMGDIALMQYTGLQDRNGTDIYEGDVLAAKFRSQWIERVYWDGPPDAICEVTWDFAGFRLTANGEKDLRYVDFWDFADDYAACDLVMLQRTETEVIGNIYENPELLKPSK